MRRAAALLGLIALSAVPLGAQTGGGSLEARMGAFLASLGGPNQEFDSFFPTRGTWEWHLTSTRDGSAPVLGIWRFERADVERITAACGPMWESFTLQPENQPMGVLLWIAMEHRGGWIHRRANRFVPPGAPANAPVFVRWRREDDRWVIAAIGDERRAGRELPGYVAGMITRDTTVAPAEEVFAAGAAWFDDNRPLTFDGRFYVRYGMPRTFPAEQLSWLGMVGRVRVHVARGREALPEILFIPSEPGRYQPYLTYQVSACERPQG